MTRTRTIPRLAVVEEPEKPAPTADPWASCLPVDLRPYLDGGFPEAERPTVLARTDGNCLLYPDSTHGFVGEPEAGKTLLVQVAQARSMLAGRYVRAIDYENNLRRWLERYQGLGVPLETVVEYFHYSRITVRLLDRHGQPTEGGRLLFEQAQTYRYEVTAIDSVGGLLTSEGLDPWSDSDAELLQAALYQPLATNSGGAVVWLDHVVKDKASQGRWATGSQRKISSLSGAAYKVEMVTPWPKPNAEIRERVQGSAKISLAYDTPGGVRAYTSLESEAVMPVVAEMVVSVTSTLVEVDLVAVNGAATEKLDLEVLGYIEAHPLCSQRAVRDAITYRRDSVQRSVQKLITKGYVVDSGTDQRMRLKVTGVGAEVLKERVHRAPAIPTDEDDEDDDE